MSSSERISLARVLLTATLLTLLCGLWTMQAEVVVLATQITESVPALPAIAVLILLVWLNTLLRRWKEGWALSRGEILLIYLFVAVAISLAGCGIVRFLFALLGTPFYFYTAENEWEKLHPLLPDWLVPHDIEAVRQLYEGAEGWPPYRAWGLPLLMWSLFFGLLWWTMLCLTVLFRRQWVERERLTFPLVFLPLAILQTEEGPVGVPAFFRSGLMWLGFGLATLYNALNIANAFNPAVVCPGKFFDLGSLFTERPWSAVRPLVLHYRPELVGLGYLVSTEVSLSIWVFSLLGRLEAVVMESLGYTKAGRPFEQEQSIGAYLAMALILVFLARSHWREVGAALGGRRPSSDEPLPYPVALGGLLLGALGCFWFCTRAGMAGWVSGLYLAVVLAVALVYTRIRAEVGVPLMWMFPYYQQKKVLLYTLGGSWLMPGGDPRTLAVWVPFTVLSRGYFPSLMAYQLEGYRLAEMAGIGYGRVTVVLLASLAVGLAVAYGVHLWPYYFYGAGALRGGIWGTGIAQAEYQQVIEAMKSPFPRDGARIAATAFGFLLTALLMGLRLAFLRFPLHPLGYAMATAYGSLIWWSFFLVWAIKAAVLRWGGVRLYRSLIPFFLGFALGHFVTAGIVWGLIATQGGEVTLRYGVWFG